MLELVSVLVRASKADSAASMPVFMAVCVPFTLGTFMKPGLQPISAPPGKASLGMLCTKQTTIQSCDRCMNHRVMWHIINAGVTSPLT